MSVVNPSIALQTNPNATAGPDLNAIMRLQQAGLQLKAQQQEVQSQNALKQLFSDPENVDKETGLLKPSASAKIMAENPAFGMKYNQAAAQTQETQTRALGAKADLAEKIREMGANMADETLGTYDDAVKKGMPPQQAQQVAQQDYTKHLEQLKGSGMLTPQQVAMLPTNFDPVRVRNQLLDYKTRLTLENKDKDEARADARLRDQESHEDRLAGAQIAAADRAAAAAGRAGWDIKDITGPDGKPATVRINKITGEVKPLELEGKPVSAMALPSGSAASKPAFTPAMGDLYAAMAEQGVSLPAGMRSKDQQVIMMQGLLDRNPGKSPDEIATGIKTGIIELGAQKKETQTAAGKAGAVDVALNEIEEFAPPALEASKAVPRGNWVRANTLIQGIDSDFSDPALKNLRLRTNALLNAYDQLAARGGTDADKRKEQRSQLLTADGPEAYEVAAKAMIDEAKRAERAAVKATKVPELDDAPGKTGKSGQSAPDLSKHSDDDIAKALGWK